MFWEQKGVQEDVNLTRPAELTKKPFDAHFSDIINTYGPVYCLNLLKLKSAREVVLSNGYVKQIYESDYKANIKY